MLFCCKYAVSHNFAQSLSNIVLLKETVIVINKVKRVNRIYSWIPKKNEGRDAIENGIFCIICCSVARFILVQFTRFNVKLLI